MPTYVPELPQPGLGRNPAPGAAAGRASQLGTGRAGQPVYPSMPGQAQGQDKIPEQPSPGQSGPGEINFAPAPPPGNAGYTPPMQQQTLHNGNILTPYGIYPGGPQAANGNGFPPFTSQDQQDLAKFEQQAAPKIKAFQNAMQSFNTAQLPSNAQQGQIAKQVGQYDQAMLNSGVTGPFTPGYNPSPAGPGLNQQQIQMNVLQKMLQKMKAQGLLQ